MITHQFNYIIPNTVNEAVSELKSGNSCIIAGGVSVVKQLKKKTLKPDKLISLQKISGLSDIKFQNDKIIIGALVTLDTLLFNEEIKTKCPLLFEVLNAFTDPQIRNQATIGGCIASFENTADLPVAALALNAKVITSSGNYIVGTQSLKKDEIITSLEFPIKTSQSVYAYEKITHPANNTAVCGVAVSAEKAKNGTITNCSIALTGAVKKVIRLTKSENKINSQKASNNLITEAVKILNEEKFDFITDIEGSAEYRKHLANIVCEKALTKAFL